MDIASPADPPSETPKTDQTTVGSREAQPAEETKPSPNSPARSTCSSPDQNCAICLGKLENNSFTDSCFHQFCFCCLLEWSKVKAECPLCKQSFKSIIHNVRSHDDYDQYHLRPEEASSWEYHAGRRFRYRSTLTAERRRELALERLFMSHRLGQRSFSVTARTLWRRQQQAATSEFRRHVYTNDLWVAPPESVRRFRNTSPSFYNDNPACTHRLVPWLNRELNVVLHNHEGHVSFVMELIMSLIMRFEIRSPEFIEHVRPYLQRESEHFVHEFYNFARSPWDMAAYDVNVTYPTADHQAGQRDISSPDSDVIFISPEPTVSGSGSDIVSVTATAGDGTSRASDSATLRSDLLDTHTPELPTQSCNALERVKHFLQNLSSCKREWNQTVASGNALHCEPQAPASCLAPASEANIISPPSPQPGPSGIQSETQRVTVLCNSDENSSSSSLSSSLASTSNSDNPTSLPVATLSFNVDSSTYSSLSLKIEDSRIEEGGNSDECVVVGYIKPLKERTPEVVDLVSSSDSESSSSRRRHTSRASCRSEMNSRRRYTRSSSSSSSSSSTSSSSTSSSSSSTSSSSSSSSGKNKRNRSRWKKFKSPRHHYRSEHVRSQRDHYHHHYHRHHHHHHHHERHEKLSKHEPDFSPSRRHTSHSAVSDCKRNGTPRSPSAEFTRYYDLELDGHSRGPRDSLSESRRRRHKESLRSVDTSQGRSGNYKDRRRERDSKRK